MTPSLAVVVDHLAQRSMAPSPVGPGAWVSICPICAPLGALAGNPSPSLTVAEQDGAIVLHCTNDGCPSRRSPHLVLALIGLPAPTAPPPPVGVAYEPDEALDALTVESGPALVSETAAELDAALGLLVAVGGSLTLSVEPGGGPAVWDLDLAQPDDEDAQDDGQPEVPEPAVEEPALPPPRAARRSPRAARGAASVEEVMERVSRWLEAQPAPVSRNALESGVGGNRARLREALVLLVAEGYVATERGARNATLARSIRPYRVTTSPDTELRPADPAGEVNPVGGIA